MVGTDGSETADVAVGTAIGLAALSGARLEIVSAYEPAAIQRLRDDARHAPPDMQWVVRQRADVDAMLRAATGRAEAAGVTARACPREGDPADAIVDVAEELGADLIVVGNKGMTGARRFLLGSVPNRVSHHAPCAVLIVRTT